MKSTKEVADCCAFACACAMSQSLIIMSIELSSVKTPTILTSAAEKSDYIILLASTNTASRHQHHLSFVHRVQDGSEGFHRHLLRAVTGHVMEVMSQLLGHCLCTT